MIVMGDANLELAVEGALWGAFGTTGQRCTATSRILLHKKIARTFTQQLVKRAEKLRVGDGLKKDVQMGPQVQRAADSTSRRYVKIALEEGAKLLTGGKRLQGKAYAEGHLRSRPRSWAE